MIVHVRARRFNPNEHTKRDLLRVFKKTDIDCLTFGDKTKTELLCWQKQAEQDH